jgi:glycosyltransferase involved in cell wall biosynthesis
VFPSFGEGFGLPLLEAMANKVPVVTSNTSAMPEVAEDAARYFDPHNPEEIADSIISVLESEEIKKDMLTKGKKRIKNFSWDKTATATLQFYNDVLSNE